jgi:hypothetical protein
MTSKITAFRHLEMTGACVLGVAQRARFGPMESGVTFRLPVALRVR